MTTNHHTAISFGASATSANINSPLGELDSTITNMLDGTQAFSAIDANGGNIDGATIGASSPAAATVTTLETSSTITMAEIAAPSTPATGKGVVYPKTDGLLYFKNDAGTEYDLTVNNVNDLPLVFSPLFWSAENGTWGWVANTNQYNSGYIAPASIAVTTNWIEYTFSALAGTYTLGMIGYQASNYGISTIETKPAGGSFTNQGTMDWYNAGAAYNTKKTLSITLVDSGDHVLKISISTKNVSSTSYGFLMSELVIY